MNSSMPNDLLRSLDNESNRRERIIVESRDLVDDDEGDDELDVDLEDTIVMHDNEDGDDSEIVYTRRHAPTTG